MSVTITIGWTYDSDFWTYQPDLLQHEVAFIIDGFTVGEDVTHHTVAESVYEASNALGAGFACSRGTLADYIQDAIEESGWHGHSLKLDRHTGQPATVYTPPEDVLLFRGHFSLSVGDTVTVDGVKMACLGVGFGVVDAPCANCGESVMQSGADRRWYHNGTGLAMCSNRGESGNAGAFPLFANPPVGVEQ